MLRLQAFASLAVLIIAACSIAWIFMSLQRHSSQDSKEPKSRDPYDYRLMEARHEAISSRLKEFSELLTDAKQELIADKYGKAGANQVLVAKLLQTRSEEMTSLRAELESRLAKDRQNMYLEILQLRAERDRAREEGAEKRSFIRLVSEAVMRVGVLVLAVYLIAIISSIVKYWLRVSDHLNSVADSLDLLRSSGFSVEPAIAALTPHPIDFQVEDINPSKTIKELLGSASSKLPPKDG